VATSFLFSLFYLQLMKAFPKALIYLGMAMSLALFSAMAIFCFTLHEIAIGVLLLLLAGVYAIYLFWVRHRIPFAVEMISNSVTIVHQYPGTQLVAYGSLVHILWSILWLYTLYHASTLKSSSAIACLVYLIFSLYWVSEVIRNVVHVTVSGTTATWYFMQSTMAMPQNPTLGALKRSVTTSLGSICLGSLVVAIIKTIRSLVKMSESRLSFIASCLLGCLEAIIRYFNHYAFCQVAIYGKTFCNAATDTWELLQRSGVAAIANDNIIDGVLLVGSLFGSVVVGGIASLLSYHWEDLGSPLGLFFTGALIGLLMISLTMQVVDSVITCTFVCYAENPHILSHVNPNLYSRLTEADTMLRT